MDSSSPIKSWRERERCTQISLARLLAVSLITVQKWEWGIATPTGHRALALERLTGIKAEEVQAWRDSMQSTPSTSAAA